VSSLLFCVCRCVVLFIKGGVKILPSRFRQSRDVMLHWCVLGEGILGDERCSFYSPSVPSDVYIGKLARSMTNY